ncbi:glycosyltransferase 87 family protein [Candidatus Frankia alpina]|uniref:glycosyltransferase 87 family protein n=1 Tax=Candidatus Frankia alpina TaxID=2699483 RepID=UPI003013BF22
MAQAYFTAVHYLPGPPREHKLQLYGSLLSLALTGLLMRMLIARGRDPRYAAFYALSPLAGLEIGSDAHVDVLGALLALAGLAVLTRRRLHPPPVLPVPPGWPESPSSPGAQSPTSSESASPSRWRAVAAGALLGAAVAVKLYPALLLPAVARRRPVALVGAALGVVGLAYLPHLFAVGTGVLGFLPQYLDAEGYGQGARFLLLVGVLHLGGSVAKAVAVAVLATVTVAVWRTDPDRGAARTGRAVDGGRGVPRRHAGAALVRRPPRGARRRRRAAGVAGRGRGRLPRLRLAVHRPARRRLDPAGGLLLGRRRPRRDRPAPPVRRPRPVRAPGR